jgi:hypothetical protein
MTNMGIGKLGNPDVRFIRKWRWLAELTSQDDKIIHLKPTFVKLPARPASDAEKECSQSNDFVHHCIYKDYQTVSFTIYDANPDAMKDLYSYLSKVYEFTKPSAQPNFDIYAKLKLSLLDGCGNLMESFLIKDAFVTSINFGELSFSSSEECEIELTFRYKETEFRDEIGLKKV